MQKRVLVFVLTLLIGLGGYSQNKLTGVIIDEGSGSPVPDAYILLTNGIGVASDSVGQFSIVVKKMPVTLKITHVSYGQSDIKITQWPKGILVIRIQKMISKLEEVQISAERMRILTEKNDFSLQDFAIDSTHLWMLGYINNRPKYGLLWIANLFGDTLHSIPVKKPEKLYKDVFGNIHLLFEDSVFQLYGKPDTIGLFAPLVGTMDKLYVLNLYLDSLLVYDTSGAFVNSISVSFHKDLTLLKGINYKKLIFMSDQSTDKVFCLERENTGWMLCEMNTYSGTLEEIPLPDFPGMKSITVSNNAVYFLYPEKKYPFYSRLHRYQL